MADTAYMTSEAMEEERLMLDAIEKWLEQKVRPVAMELEHANEYPIELVEDMKELGLFGALIDPEYGGLGLSASLYAKIVTLISEEGAEDWPRMGKDQVAARLAAKIAEALG